MSDTGLFIVDNCINLQLTDDGSTLKRDDGLETAVLLSLFTDRRVAQSEVPDGDESKRGWWGDLVSDIPGDQIGSKLWILERSKLLNATAQATQTRAEQALAWMIEDGVAESVGVVVTIDGQVMNIKVSIKKPDDAANSLFSMFWDGQSLKRA